MQLSAGEKLGSYEIHALIGNGGMGEVYRARDATLNRDVAIKVLPPELAADADYRTRFEQEAQVLASLNHPKYRRDLRPGRQRHRHGIGGRRDAADAVAGGRGFADCQTDRRSPGSRARTRDRPSQGPQASVITPGADSPTVRATQAGLILGTAGYMSPEQAAGKPVDRRADIWAFGVVLYELLVGERLFDGETISHTLADVLRKEIDFGKLPVETPAPWKQCRAERSLRK